MVSDFTLSRQRENVAGLEVVSSTDFCLRERRQSNHRLKLAPLERLAASESGLEVVPPLELIAFAGLPTEKDDAAVPHTGKIN